MSRQLAEVLLVPQEGEEEEVSVLLLLLRLW